MGMKILPLCAVVLGAVLGLLLFALRDGGKGKGGLEKGTKAEASTSPTSLLAAEPEYERTPVSRTSHRGLVPESSSQSQEQMSTLDDGATSPIAVAYGPRIASLVETFVTDDPDVLGWNSLFGELAMLAELDPLSMSKNAGRAAKGEFTVPGTDMRIVFELTDEKYNVVLKGGISPKTIPDAEFDFRAQMGGAVENGGISKGWGAVQVLPKDSKAESALDQHVVGYVYELSDVKTVLRPLNAQVHQGLYQLQLPPEAASAELGYGDLQPAHAWLFRLQSIQAR